MSNNPLNVSDADWQRQQVLTLLDEALVPGDVAMLKSMVTADCRIVFPGFEGRGHHGVEALMAMIGQIFDGCPTKSYELWVHGRQSVNVHGALFGRMSDGRSMDGNRYTDTFVFDDKGRITDWLVYNDLALLPPA
ncbi:nuclear transport factor 2 family protein [Algiphilus sp.]|uniref:nuclear transport factor 2 family protein n=1 Tax=Algiphilus sp. TaxID=1872431 RepID=UPI0032EE60E6